LHTTEIREIPHTSAPVARPMVIQNQMMQSTVLTGI